MTQDALHAQITAFDTCVVDHDQRLAEKVLDVDFALVLIQPAPAVMPRAAWLATLPEYIVHSWQVIEQTIDLDGDIAAVLRRVDMRATVLGADRSGLFVISDIWRKRDDGWRIWRRHSTPLSAGSMPRS